MKRFFYLLIWLSFFTEKALILSNLYYSYFTKCKYFFHKLFISAIHLRSPIQRVLIEDEPRNKLACYERDYDYDLHDSPSLTIDLCTDFLL